MIASEYSLHSIRSLLKDKKADGILVSGMPNVRYFSGFSGSEATLYINPRRKLLFTDSRYITQAKEQAKGFKVIQYLRKIEDIASHLTGSGASRILFEAGKMSVEMYKQYKSALKGIALISANEELERIRAIKNESEIYKIEQAVEVASAAFEEILPLIKPGITERGLAAILEMWIRMNSSAPAPFETIVASGPRGAMPHGTASEKPVRKGELITFDFGSVYEGYNSDQTITVCLGKAAKKQIQIYEIVREAQARAINALRPGIACKDVDSIARDYIKEAGYGKYFGHGLGHGVGLEVHEKPSLGPRSTDRLEPGMVVTVEPGIYIPGWGGVRIEDMVLVTQQGHRVLTASSGQLRIITN